ncbi:MAG: hypothetical protein R3C53_12895 [Pirellulaceae bacterium]
MRVWVWLGLAVAWHPVVGGWSGLTVGMLWLSRPQRLARLRLQFKWLLLATLVGLAELGPLHQASAASIWMETWRATSTRIFASCASYEPRTFELTRHISAAFSLATLICMTLWWRRNIQAQTTFNQVGREVGLRGVGSLLAIAWFAVVISLIGLAIDIWDWKSLLGVEKRWVILLVSLG